MMQLRDRMALMFFIAALTVGASPALAQEMAIVSRHMIYPGQTVEPASLQMVDASDCPNCDEGFLRDAADAVGKIAVRSLLPGRLIFLRDLREAPLITRGKEVRVFYRKGRLQISMNAIPLNDAAAGQEVSVRNSGTGAVIKGIVHDDGAVWISQ